MPTKLFLRNTLDNPITDSGDTVLYDMVVTAGGAVDTDIVDTVVSGTEIQWTQETTLDQTIAWISGRVPAGGFTLTNTDISVWCLESMANVNAGGRYRVYKYSGGTVTELGGGPFDDGVEFSTTITEMTWPGDVSNTVFAENDRILLRVFISSAGFGAGTCDIQFNAADGSTGDSFFNIAETVAFKAEEVGQPFYTRDSYSLPDTVSLSQS